MLQTPGPIQVGCDSAYFYGGQNESYFADSRFHLFAADRGQHGLFITESNAVYVIDEEYAAELRNASLANADVVVHELLLRISGGGALHKSGFGLSTVEPHSFSLAISQLCNLGCKYCYADGGDFGGPSLRMSQEIARQSVDQLLREVAIDAFISISFMGGEPLTNRAVLRDCVEYASAIATCNGQKINFGLTTNATLITDSDIEFLSRHAFTVTVSIDGSEFEHNNLRPYKNGAGSYRKTFENVRKLLEHSSSLDVSARVSVTPENLKVSETVDSLSSLGFSSVGFSPVVASPTAYGELSESDLEVFLEEMIACSHRSHSRILRGETDAFYNHAIAMAELHRGAVKKLPCGAGAGYFGVSASGQIYACHRFVNDPTGYMGDLSSGVDPELQQKWLMTRQVDNQEPCASCWARNLCGGGCHQEVIARGRTTCGFVRAWLSHCLASYLEMTERAPKTLDTLASQLS